MRLIHKFVALCLVLMLATVASVHGWSMQDSESIVAHANGNGLLKLGDEEFKITSVVVKLFKDGKAEISLVSEITVFVSGTWARDANSKKINLKITGGATGGGVEATGELTLRGETRSIDRVSLQGQSKTTHRNVSLNFQSTE